MTSNSETAATAQSEEGHALWQVLYTCWLVAALNIFELLAIACGLYALDEGQYVHHIPYSYFSLSLSLSPSRGQACTVCRDWYHSLLNESIDLISHRGSQEKSTSTDAFPQKGHHLPSSTWSITVSPTSITRLDAATLSKEYFLTSEPDWSIRSACSHNRSLRPSICPHMGSLHPVADGLSAHCQSSWHQLLQDKSCRSCSVWSNKDLVRT